MATLPRIRVTAPQNVIDAYGTGALVRLERGTSSAMTDAAEVTTIEVVVTATEYEWRDATGEAGTHWYRSRYSTATPTLSTHYSGYGPVFQAGASGGEVVSLEAFKRWADIEDTVDDPWLPLAIGACNRAVVGTIGVDLGPSPDTVRLYDGDAALDDGTELWIPGGIRTFTTVEVTEDDGTTWTDVTADVRIRPAAHARPPGEPGSHLAFIGSPAGSYSRFPEGTDNVRITGPAFRTFAWDAWPDDIVQDVQAGLQRMSIDRERQNQAYPSETSALRYLNAKLLLAYRERWFPRAR